MNISEIITAERIDTGNEVKSKKRVLEEVSSLLAEGTPYLTAAEIFTSLVNREKLGTTALGDGVAIPHGRLKGVEQAIGALLRLEDGVDFEANDGRPADLIFGLIVPEESTEEHLNILRGLAEMFTSDEFCDKLRKAKEPTDLYTLLAEHEPATSES